MSKVFDNVNLERLIMTFKRVDLPETFIIWIHEMHTERKAKVITSFGLTKNINIETGIKQGETYSLILWSIYYNLILEYIFNKHKNDLIMIESISPLEIATAYYKLTKTTRVILP